MRWSASFSACLLLRALEASASLSETSTRLPTVYLYDPQSPSSDRETESTLVNPHVAGLIFAQRLGVAAYHDLGEITDLDLQQLNTYTKPSTAPFSSASEDRQYDHALVIVDNAAPVEDADTTSFQLSTSPQSQHGIQLLDSFSQDARRTHGSTDRQPERIIDTLLELETDPLRRRRWQAIGSEDRRIDLVYYDANASAQVGGEIVGQVIDAAKKGSFAITLVVNPKPARSSAPGNNVFGNLFSSPQETLKRRQEAPLIEPEVMDEAAATSPVRAQPLATSFASLPLTPQCYDSAESCGSETNSCSGHGKCVLARKAPASGDEDEPTECYQCKCEPQVVKNDDGTTKTTYYGGSACHKKDISAPFWILTLTTGSLVALVGFGISMLVAMGNAELPSVIGAGVSGPRAK